MASGCTVYRGHRKCWSDSMYATKLVQYLSCAAEGPFTAEGSRLRGFLLWIWPGNAC